MKVQKKEGGTGEKKASFGNGGWSKKNDFRKNFGGREGERT